MTRQRQTREPRQTCLVLWVSVARGGRDPDYRGTPLMRDPPPLGPYRRPMPRVLGWSYGGGHFLKSELPL